MTARVLLAAAAALALAACAQGRGPQPSPVPGSPSLHERLGGTDAIRAVVTDFTSRLAGDARTGPLFRGVDFGELNRLLVEQVCEASGGPCRYSGRPMREAHAGLGITEEQWNITVAHLLAAMEAAGAAAPEQRELAAIVATMKRDIVGR